MHTKMFEISTTPPPLPQYANVCIYRVLSGHLIRKWQKMTKKKTYKNDSISTHKYACWVYSSQLIEYMSNWVLIKKLYPIHNFKTIFKNIADKKAPSSPAGHNITVKQIQHIKLYKYLIKSIIKQINYYCNISD